MYVAYTFTLLDIILFIDNNFLMQMDKVLAPLKTINPLLDMKTRRKKTRRKSRRSPNF